MKAIIYYRKSTDRDDKQANSLEHQLNSCRKTAELNNIDIYKEIGESKSAKTEFTREGFNEMIKLCKLGKVDYIICDEPKRLSRNNLDTSRIIDLLDKKQIKGVLGTSREYHAENSRDKFLLQLDLSLSKMDNEDRANDIKAKMITALKKGQWVGKAPIGYKNVTIRKGHHEVIIDEHIGPIIKEGFELRVKGYSYTKIADFFYEKGLTTSGGLKFSVEKVKRILNNKFYMGIMTWDNIEVKGNYKPLITKEIFYKSGEHNKISIITNKKRIYKLSGILKDFDQIGLSGYIKKGNVYYHHSNRSRFKISISEKLIFEKFGLLLKNFSLTGVLKDITLDMLTQLYSKVNSEDNIDINNVKQEIKVLENRKSILIDKYLDGEIKEDIYKKKLSEIELKIIENEKKLKPKSLYNNEKLKKIKKCSELFKSFYQSNSLLNIEEKLDILKSFNSELLVNNKKELQLAENRLLELLKKLNFHIWYSQGELNSCLDRERVPS